MERKRECREFIASQTGRSESVRGRQLQRQDPQQRHQPRSESVGVPRQEPVTHDTLPKATSTYTLPSLNAVRKVVPHAFEDPTENQRKQESIAKYREELAEQIRVKKALKEEEERKMRAEDEKWNRKVEAQRKQLREEYEKEMERINKKSQSQPNLSRVGLSRKHRSVTQSNVDEGKKPDVTPTSVRVRSPSYVQIKDIVRRKQTQTHTIEYESGPSMTTTATSSSETSPIKRISSRSLRQQHQMEPPIPQPTSRQQKRESKSASAPSTSFSVHKEKSKFNVSREAPRPAPRTSKIPPQTTQRKQQRQAPIKSAVPSLHNVRRKMQDDHRKLLVKMASLQFES